MNHPPHFPDDGNGAVLRRLHARGDDLTQPRTLDFWFIFPERRQALAFADIVDGKDTDVSISYYEERALWQVKVERHMVPEHGTISALEASLTAQANSVGGEADGWGCMFVAKQRRPTPQQTVVLLILLAIIIGAIWTSIQIGNSQQLVMEGALRAGMERFYLKLAPDKTTPTSQAALELLLSPDGTMKILPGFLEATNVFVPDYAANPTGGEALLEVRHQNRCFRIDSKGKWGEWGPSEFERWSQSASPLSQANSR